jgi:hypothetical protein
MKEILFVAKLISFAISSRLLLDDLQVGLPESSGG